MKVALTSDLHVDHHPEVAALVLEEIRSRTDGDGADLLIIAGDLTHHEDRLEAALTTLRPAARAAVFVAGNHDLWVKKDPTSPTSRDRYERSVPARARSAGFHPLGFDALTVDGYRIVGVTGWYDYSLRNRELDSVFSMDDYRRGSWGRLRWNDKLHVVWPGDDGDLLDDVAICETQILALERQLAVAPSEPTIVVTHHLPFQVLTTSKGEPPWDFLNGFMGSARLGEAILRTPGVRLAVAGHTHFRKSAVLDGIAGSVRAEISPIGYPREYRRASQDLPARVKDRVLMLDLP